MNLMFVAIKRAFSHLLESVNSTHFSLTEGFPIAEILPYFALLDDILLATSARSSQIVNLVIQNFDPPLLPIIVS